MFIFTGSVSDVSVCSKRDQVGGDVSVSRFDGMYERSPLQLICVYTPNTCIYIIRTPFLLHENQVSTQVRY